MANKYTEIAHLHFKAVVAVAAVAAVVVHFLPHLQFQASDVNKFFVRVVDDRDRVGEDEGGREEGGVEIAMGVVRSFVDSGRLFGK